MHHVNHQKSIFGNSSLITVISVIGVLIEGFPKAIPTFALCPLFGRTAIAFLMQHFTDSPPRLIALFPQPFNLLDGAFNVVNSGSGSIKDVCTALLNGCGNLLKAGDGVELGDVVSHGVVLSRMTRISTDRSSRVKSGNL